MFPLGKISGIKCFVDLVITVKKGEIIVLLVYQCLKQIKLLD